MVVVGTTCKKYCHMWFAVWLLCGRCLVIVWLAVWLLCGRCLVIVWLAVWLLCGFQCGCLRGCL